MRDKPIKIAVIDCVTLVRYQFGCMSDDMSLRQRSLVMQQSNQTSYGRGADTTMRRAWASHGKRGHGCLLVYFVLFHDIPNGLFLSSVTA